MSKYVSFFGLLASALIFSSNLVVADEVNVTDEVKEEITASCTAESVEAANPQEYLADCIEEKLQALKEESQDTKEPS